MLISASNSMKGSVRSKKSTITLITPALFKRALAIITVNKIIKPKSIAFEISICLLLLVLVSDIVNPQTNGTMPRWRRLTTDGNFNKVRTRGKKALQNDNIIRVESWIYPFLFFWGVTSEFIASIDSSAKLSGAQPNGKISQLSIVFFWVKKHFWLSSSEIWSITVY